MIGKREALYVDHPVGGERCDGCTMYLNPDRCTLVAGLILPDGHCQYWEPKTTVKIAKSFAEVIKGEPGVDDVHVGTSLGNQSPKRRRYKPFSAFVSGAPKKLQDGPSTFGPSPVTTATSKRYASVKDLPPAVSGKLKGKKARQWLHVWNSAYDAHGDEGRAFASAWAAVGKNLPPPITGAEGRTLHPLSATRYHVPFAYDPSFLPGLSGEEVPRFLGALTHRKNLEKATVPLAKLRAIQDQVSASGVRSHLDEPTGKRPVIVKARDAHYIADGHDRLTAWWLSGKDYVKVWVYDLDSSVTPQNKNWEIPLEIMKADPDQRLIFGWASIVTKNGKLVVDHQNDVISADELEKAFYDYVLYARNQGHMHSQMGVGRLVECMMFTKQKQDVLKIVVRDEDGDQIEGAWVGYFVDDDAVWKAHKRGELPAFSIGGAAVPIEVEV